MILKDDGQTKVSYFDLWFLSSVVEEDVLVLNVSVHYLLQMDILNPHC